MLKTLKGKVLAVSAGVGALAPSVFASEGGSTTSVDWTNMATKANTAFGDVISAIAPVAIGVVILVAGVRVFIKLINRGAGK